MKHLFFLGIAGHAMAGLALAAQNRGYIVSGLDEAGGPPMSDWLTEHGLKWSREYDPGQIKDIDAVVISGQHGSDDHPVIVAARERELRVLSFAELFGELTAGKHVIAVSGTHGKTTTTSFIAWLMQSAGRRPDYLIGIRPFNFDSSSRLDGTETVVVEADEYKASTLDDRSKFEFYHPNTLIITSIEHDHPDIFPDLQSVLERFERAVSKMPANGRLVVWSGSDTVRQVAAKAKCKLIAYGLEEGDYVAGNIAYLPAGIEFDVKEGGEVLGRLAVPLYGRHNVLNALAATVVALTEGLPFDSILKGAATFKGAFRRFNIVSGADSPVTVIDDYAHHPTEVQTTIEAAKLHFSKHRLIVVFRPHTYSRTKALLSEYHRSFEGADVTYITDIETAREAANERTVSGSDVAMGIPGAFFEPGRDRLAERLAAEAKPGDVILCMSVSGYDKLANELAERLAKIEPK